MKYFERNKVVGGSGKLKGGVKIIREGMETVKSTRERNKTIYIGKRKWNGIVVIKWSIRN